jgi:hypothetical protein
MSNRGICATPSALIAFTELGLLGAALAVTISELRWTAFPADLRV